MIAFMSPQQFKEKIKSDIDGKTEKIPQPVEPETKEKQFDIGDTAYVPYFYNKSNNSDTLYFNSSCANNRFTLVKGTIIEKVITVKKDEKKYEYLVDMDAASKIATNRNNLFCAHNIIFLSKESFALYVMRVLKEKHEKLRNDICNHIFNFDDLEFLQKHEYQHNNRSTI